MYFWWWPNFGKRPSGDAEKLSSVPVWRTWKGEILALLGHNGAGKSGAEAATENGNLSVVCQWKAFNRVLENRAQIGKEVRPDRLKSFWSFWGWQTELRSTTVSMLTGVLPPTEASERSAWTCWCGRTNPKVSDDTSHFESQSMHVFRQLQIRCSLVSANLSIKVTMCWQHTDSARAEWSFMATTLGLWAQVQLHFFLQDYVCISHCTLWEINIDPGSHRGWKTSFHDKNGWFSGSNCLFTRGYIPLYHKPITW